jgi:hypothetical protein
MRAMSIMPMPGAPPAAPVAPAPDPGLEARARLMVMAARKALEQAVPILGAGSDDGKKVITALRALGDVTGEAADGLLASEHQALGQAVQAVPPGGGMPMTGPTPGPGSMMPGRPMGAPGGPM